MDSSDNHCCLRVEPKNEYYQLNCLNSMNTPLNVLLALS